MIVKNNGSHGKVDYVVLAPQNKKRATNAELDSLK